MITLNKPAKAYSSDERAVVYAAILKEEKSKIIPQATGITRGQISAAKSRATLKFFKIGF